MYIIGICIGNAGFLITKGRKEAEEQEHRNIQGADDQERYELFCASAKYFHNILKLLLVMLLFRFSEK